MPATMMALTNNDDDEYYDYHRSPSHQSYAYITYNEATSIATVFFRTTFADAEVVILKDGYETESLSLVATEGMQILIDLSAYGEGEFTIQVKRGTTLLVSYCISL